ncbi:MAG: DUF58 domain-containing protein [Fulvivirga sp.]|nr:DUF58 domain-containing protein [Fulvivirga sp.]
MKIIKSLYLNNRLFQVIGGLVTLFILSFFYPGLIILPQLLFFLLIICLLADGFLLYGSSKSLNGYRFTPEKLSNGDSNEIRVFLENYYSIPIWLKIYEELPHQFQIRDQQMQLSLQAKEKKSITYYLRPVKRGAYAFGAVNVLTSSPLGLIARRFKFSQDKTVPVYPSYIQMRKYELMAISNNLTELGIKKIRKIGHNMEFEQIREYVIGDDYRTINWKATARKGGLMVNNYQDEKSQQVYSLIDKSRTMQMPFEGMSLLDYAINASLVISNIAIKKDDKAGLITFQHKIGTLLPASKRSKQMHLILETLYNQKTAYKEVDYSKLFTLVRRKITQRSLLLLFTNFESLSGMHRQLPYLKKLSKFHLVVVIFFENTEVKKLIASPAEKIKEVYRKAVAEKLAYEKSLIAKELNSHGIHTVLTQPKNLNVDTINKYLELKSRGLI